MKRPSLQFYPGDWQRNAKLRRCTFAERGIWLAVICLFHDSDEYGLLRWPLKDIAQAVGCKVTELKAIAAKGVLKGSDEAIEPLVFTPRHAGKDGEPVTLLPAQSGPLWYSSRMVRDEYVRTKRGEGSRFGATPDNQPKGGIGETPKAAPIRRQGDGASTASSSTPSVKAKEQSASQGSRLPADWALPEEWRVAAQSIRAEWSSENIDFVAEKFRDYWHSKPGAAGRKIDWLATWRNWCREEKTQGTKKRETLAELLAREEQEAANAGN